MAVHDGEILLRGEGLRVALGGREVLCGVELDLRAGELVVVVGPNGAGKTTLLRALAGALGVRGGRVEVAGKPLEGYARRALARELAYLPQETFAEKGLLVREVVALGRYAHRGAMRPLRLADRAAVEQAMEQADVAGLAGRPVGTLSGGERRRVDLARAIAQEARVLVLDEPTTALDVGHAVTVMRMLARLAAEGRAVLASLHDLSLALRGPRRALLLDRGELVAEGEPARVLTGAEAARAFGVELVRVGEPPAVLPVASP